MKPLLLKHSRQKKLSPSKSQFRKLRILTVTPNPALDVSGVVDDLLPNEKNAVHDERRDPGGNGINAARIICRLGGRTQVTALGFLGGSTGQELMELLAQEKIPLRFTKILGNTRVNITVSNKTSHEQTRLSFSGPKIRQQEKAALFSSVSRSAGPGILILGGSLPQGLTPRFYGDLGNLGQRKGMGLVIDVPSRHLQSTLEALEEPALALKPNQVELAEWAGVPHLKTTQEIIAAATRLTAKAVMILVSLGKDGALLVAKHAMSDAPMVLRGRAPKIRAKGTVGAGDSMVGAFSLKLLELGIYHPSQILPEDPNLEAALTSALQWGMAAGAATAESQGTHLAKNKGAVQKLAQKIQIFRVG